MSSIANQPCFNQWICAILSSPWVLSEPIVAVLRGRVKSLAPRQHCQLVNTVEIGAAPSPNLGVLELSLNPFILFGHLNRLKSTTNAQFAKYGR